MKYTYSIGEYSLVAEIDDSLFEDTEATDGIEVAQTLKERVQSTMTEAVINELYQKFVVETNNLVVNEEPITIDAGGLNAVLEGMARRYTTWLHEKGLITVHVTEE